MSDIIAATDNKKRAMLLKREIIFASMLFI